MVPSVQAPTAESSENAAASYPRRKKINPGRNLFSAIIVGCILGLFVIVPVFYYPFTWFIVVTIAVIIAVLEVAFAMRSQGVHLSLILLLPSSAAIVMASNNYGSRGFIVSLIVVVLANMLWLLITNDTASLESTFTRNISMTLLVIMWIPVLASCSVLMINEENGYIRVFSFMLIAVGSDIFGYFTGILFGKHLIAAAISPKKTWEGFIGSLLGGTLLSYFSLTFFINFPLAVAISSGPIIVGLAFCGDLVESQIKRDLKIKDMGSLLPGHGGLMDRLDSILLSSGAAWLMWQFFL